MDDCVDAMLMAASSEKANGQLFNLGGDCVISLKDLAKKLAEANGSGNYINRSFPDDRKKIDIGDYYSDYTLIRKTLGWKPEIPLEESLKRTIEFYRKNMECYI